MVSAAMNSGDARAELERRGIEFSADAFVSAAGRGELAVVKLFVESGMSVETANEYGFTALHWAASWGHLEVVRFLVEDRGADVNAREARGWTALLGAARFGYLEVIRFLVEKHGADVRATTDDGFTALHLSARGGSLELVKWLVDRGLDARAVADRGGGTARALAEGSGHRAVADYLESVGG